jgi:glycosyltransferase involved in cell wall biosynthesis
MRVLFVTNLYPNPIDSFRAPFNRQLVRRLAQLHSVLVIAPILWTDELRARWRGTGRVPAGRRSEIDGVPVIHPRYYYPSKVFRSLYGACFKTSIKRTFARAVAEFKPTIVHAPWAYPDGWACVRLARKARLPVVIKALGSDVRLLDAYPKRKAGTIEALRNADGVVAVSTELADQIAGFGVPADRIRVVYDGVNPEVFFFGERAEARSRLGLPKDRIQLLFIGNLLRIKGLDVLLSACSNLRRLGVSFDLNIIGSGPLRSNLESLARSYQLADIVRFHGSLPQADLSDWYRAADQFVLPSRSEGVPNVLLEASACGTPWVSTNVGGIPEIARHGVSRLVPPDNSNALAAAIRALLSEAPAATRPVAVRDRKQTVSETIEFLEQVLTRYETLGPEKTAGSLLSKS